MSPPFPSHTSLPAINTTANGSIRKRPTDAAGPSPKRRKASNMSIASIGSAHPLRQTSFPPDEAPSGSAARSPSVSGFDDNISMVSGSAVSTTGGGRVPRKRGRKSKADKAREAADKEGTPSVAGGKALTVASGRSGGGAKSAADGDGPEDDEEDDAAVKAKMGVAQFERSREEREEEKKLRFMLVKQMDADQAERYEMWHAAKFAEASVRRVSRGVRVFSLACAADG